MTELHAASAQGGEPVIVGRFVRSSMVQELELRGAERLISPAGLVSQIDPIWNRSIGCFECGCHRILRRRARSE